MRPDPGFEGQGGQGSYRHLQQLRRRRFWSRNTAQEQADQEGHLFLPGWASGIRTTVSGQGGGSGAGPARDDR